MLDANYGRLDRQTCPHSHMNNTDCRASNSLQIVRATCNGKTECQLHAKSFVFGGDPCKGTYKYLEVKYRCLEYIGERLNDKMYSNNASTALD